MVQDGNKKIDRSPRPKNGFTLTELAIVMTLIGILAALSVPSFRQVIEQSRADLACANLRAIWAAERLHWLEHQNYADLATLQSEKLLDANFNASTTPYNYEVSISVDGLTFNYARATRIKSGYGSNWGYFEINNQGQLTGTVSVPGVSNAITPSSYW